MKSTVFIGLLLSLNALTGPAAASENQGAIIGHAPLLVAQLSGDERRALRDRWERTDDEEREVLRRAFRERLREASPEQREILRHELVKKWKNLPPEERARLRQKYRESDAFAERDDDERDGKGRGFGRGYERRFEGEQGGGNQGHGRGRNR